MNQKEKIKGKSPRIELWFVPILIIFPIFVSIFLLLDWYYRGFSLGISTYDSELIIAIIIWIGNIIFDIPFLKSFKSYD